MNRRLGSFFALFAGVALGCGSDSEGSPEAPTASDVPTAQWASINERVIQKSCALSGCHDAQGNYEVKLDLTADKAYANMVNVKSSQVDMPMVKPSDPDHSYLWHKVNGTAASVGGDPGRMPDDEAALSAATLQVIRTWIAEGAKNN